MLRYALLSSKMARRRQLIDGCPAHPHPIEDVHEELDDALSAVHQRPAAGQSVASSLATEAAAGCCSGVSIARDRSKRDNQGGACVMNVFGCPGFQIAVSVVCV